MGRKKLKRFEQNKTFPNFFQPSHDEVINGFFLKGKWHQLYFRNQNPITLELGCGKGDYTIALAQRFPEKNFIGIDIKGDRLWVGCKKALDGNLKNVAFLRRHISDIEHLFDKNEVAEIWLTFPDPYPRNRDARRRLTSPEYLLRYEKILQPGAIIHLKTDNQQLFEYTIKVCQEFGCQIVAQSDNIYLDNLPGIVTEIQTHYEKKWIEEGRTIHYVAFRLKQTEQNALQANFFERVWHVVRQIPYGRVTSYKAIANYLGCTGSARMVGWALNASTNVEPPVPAHRVVNREGYLTGKMHFPGQQTMQKLLESEGIKVENDRIVDFEKIFWDPSEHLPPLSN